MCRHQAWLGEPRSLAALVLEPEHGLLRQSYQPRRQARGLMNADGWGVGFHAEGADEPVRWRSDRPLWSDASFASVAPVLRSGCVLAAVRSATPGMPAGPEASAPFTDGTWLVSHNGRLDASGLPVSGASAESSCDSALLARHVLDHGLDALVPTVRDVAALDPGAFLNLLATDGTCVLGLTWGDPLSYLLASDGIVVASEPYDDDPGWVDVPDRHLIEASAGGVRVSALEDL